MNRHLRDAVADDSVHGLAHSSEWWFVTAQEIQLRFSSGQRVYGKVGLREREQARHQRLITVETKEIQLRPVTDENDLLIKAKRARGFLDGGDRVKVIVRFRGRERAYKYHGQQIIERFLTHVGDHKIDKPMMGGDSDLTIILGSVISKADIVKRLKPDPATTS